jgi:septal ring factor EnvC (AmiA/AmiB activator)
LSSSLSSNSSSGSNSSSSSETVSEQVKRIKNQLQQSKLNLNDMNFTEKDRLNKIKQQRKAIEAVLCFHQRCSRFFLW